MQPADKAPIPMDMIERFVELNEQKRKLEAELTNTKQDIAGVEEQLLAVWEGSGLRNIAVGGHTVYLSRMLFASPVDGDRLHVCDALCASGLVDLVRNDYNSQTLNAFVRGYERDRIALPPMLAAALTLTEEFSLRVRRS